MSKYYASYSEYEHTQIILENDFKHEETNTIINNLNQFHEPNGKHFNVLLGYEIYTEKLVIDRGVFFPSLVSQWFAKILDDEKLNGLVIEYGVGSGILTRVLSKHASFVLGIDISYKATQLAKKNCLASNNVTFITCDLGDCLVGVNSNHLVFNMPFFFHPNPKGINKSWYHHGELFINKMMSSAKRICPNGTFHFLYSTLCPIMSTYFMEKCDSCVCVKSLGMGKEKILYCQIKMDEFKG